MSNFIKTNLTLMSLIFLLAPQISFAQYVLTQNESNYLSILERSPSITRLHFYAYCAQCHHEWREALSTDESSKIFFQGMRSIMVYEMQRGLMPKSTGRYQPSAQLKDKMIRFLQVPVK